MRLLILLFVLFQFSSCKKEDSDPPLPASGKELQTKLLGKWSVENVDIKEYENDVLDPSSSENVDFEENEFTVEFKKDLVIFTSGGEQDELVISYDSKNSFRYGLGNELYEAEIEFEDGKLIWKEKATVSSVRKVEITITLHKVANN
ncbi:hypothetical protein NF867_11180 [Solitalea sp. MAHUQ-68]|uniref:Lipocalin-like domain-containing protein n=1 Tax=Solitalea agri TaxID=2953739 RepID=A0A9X2F2J1_9SPHI|nr:hypothetical protein [Solitalea agri]MCO4293427.1 hypothetical protein [Solitalea agri]